LAKLADVDACHWLMAEAKRTLLADVRNAKLALTCVLRRDGHAKDRVPELM